MKTFRDNKGREWLIAVNVTAIKRVRGLVNINLLDVLEHKADLLRRLVSNIELVCDVLYALCKPEADSKGVTDVDFGEALAGDAIDQATTVLLDELADFFPSPNDRANLKRLIEATHQAAARAQELVEVQMRERLPLIIDSVLENVKSSFGSLPGSAASTPDPSPSPKSP